MGSARTRAWLAYDGEKIVGFATLRHLDTGEAYFDRCGILSSHRGRGLDRRLRGGRRGGARRHELTHIITYVVSDNFKSLGSLVRSGYEIYSPEFAWIGENQVFYLRKAL